jgi:hypothetical protein
MANRTPFHLALICCALGGLKDIVVAQSVSSYAVRVSATVQTNPAQIALSWPADTLATGYTLYRKGRDDTSWGTSVAALAGNATNFSDSNVTVGGAYEYQIRKSTSSYPGEGDIYAGIQAPLTESRGKVVLLVDNTLTASLTNELARLQQDLVGDGWTVLRHDVPRMAVDPANTSSSVWAARSNELANVKALITADYTADPANVKAVFLFGHVPVPYSGDIAPDEHPNHTGAWPGDVYYANLTGAWTDSSAWDQNASDTRNWNMPGDGKLDPSLLPSDVTLQVGRVDLANLPSLSQSETALLRQYLVKEHNFRMKFTTAQPRGLIDDNLGLLGGEEPAVNGWRNFAPFFGATNSFASSSWFGTLSTNSYLWGYGCGSGTYTSCSGVGSTANFAASDPQVVFTMFFGSYFGDWDSTNNFLRAALGTTNYTLTSAWVGRPYWFFHHMALGETIGFSTRVSQNNISLYSSGFVGARWIHIALMGDPTLRMHVVAPPSGLVVATNASGGVGLNWTASPDTVLGYHVYRAPTAAGPFTRLTTDLITGTSYTDPAVTTNVYMVRAVKLEVSGSGSYYNASQGIFGQWSNTPPVAGADTIERDPGSGVKVSITALLANDSDADGDAIAFAGVSATSANGGTVVSNAGWIFYSPAPGFTNIDTFTYSISDGFGVPVTGTVTVNIRVDNGPSPNLTITDLGGGSYLVRGDGIPGRTYRIQFVDEAQSTNWQTLGTAAADPYGIFQFSDTNGSPQRFYRSMYP